MASVPQQLDRVRRLRMSLVILAISLGGFYYASQVFLDHQAFWWVTGMAIISGILFLVGLGMSLVDWWEERQFRNAQTAVLEDQGPEPEPEPEDEKPAEATGERDRIPSVDWGDIINR